MKFVSRIDHAENSHVKSGERYTFRKIAAWNLHSNYVKSYHVGVSREPCKIPELHAPSWGCLGIHRPPAGDFQSCRPVSTTRVEAPSYEEGIVRGLTFADPPRDAYLTMRVAPLPTQDCGGLPRGSRGGNSICSYKRA